MGLRQLFRDYCKNSKQGKKSVEALNRLQELEEENQTLKRLLAQSTVMGDRSDETPVSSYDSLPAVQKELRRSQSSVRLNHDRDPLPNRLRHKQSAPVISRPIYVDNYGTTQNLDLKQSPTITRDAREQHYQQLYAQKKATNQSKENQCVFSKPAKELYEVGMYKDSAAKEPPIKARIPEPIATSTLRNTWKQRLESRPQRTAEEEAHSILMNGHDFNKDISASEFSHWGPILKQQRSESNQRQVLAEKYQESKF